MIEDQVEDLRSELEGTKRELERFRALAERLERHGAELRRMLYYQLEVFAVGNPALTEEGLALARRDLRNRITAACSAARIIEPDLQEAAATAPPGYRS
jgi:hypothetical protein